MRKIGKIKRNYTEKLMINFIKIYYTLLSKEGFRKLFSNTSKYTACAIFYLHWESAKKYKERVRVDYYWIVQDYVGAVIGCEVSKLVYTANDWNILRESLRSNIF